MVQTPGTGRMKALALVAVLVAGTGAGLAWLSYSRFLEQPLRVETPTRIQVQPGDSVRAVVARLARLGVTADGWRWRLLLKLRPVTIQAGEYSLDVGITPVAMLESLARGDVIRYRFTIVEGWTYHQLKQALLAEAVLLSEEGLLGEDEVMPLVGGGQGHPEGWFLPETYVFVRGDTALDLLARAHAAMREALDSAWQGRQSELPLDDPYELLILASIVERETAVAAERADIAGVFTRRLQAGWRLETDPAVIYGLGPGFDGNIRRRDLEADTAYNTYTRHGLPPTPIAMPSRASLEAAAHPAAGSAMFFVADGSGGHVFSDTLEQHNAAVRRMLTRGQVRKSPGPGR